VDAIHRVHDENSSIGVPGVRERPKVERHVPRRPRGTMSQTTTWDAPKRAPAPNAGGRSTVARAGRYLPGCWLPWRYDKFVIANLYNWRGVVRATSRYLTLGTHEFMANTVSSLPFALPL